MHVIREHGPGDRVAKHALCGVQAWACQGSDPVIIDPMPACPPDGLSWCPACIGHLAETLGVLGDVAGRLAGLEVPGERLRRALRLEGAG